MARFTGGFYTITWKKVVQRRGGGFPRGTLEETARFFFPRARKRNYQQIGKLVEEVQPTQKRVLRWHTNYNTSLLIVIPYTFPARVVYLYLNVNVVLSIHQSDRREQADNKTVQRPSLQFSVIIYIPWEFY